MSNPETPSANHGGEPISGPSYGTAYGSGIAGGSTPISGERGWSERGSAGSRSPGMLITVLACVVSLLGGVVIGLLIPRGSDAPSATPTGTGVTAQQQAPAQPEPAPSATPTISEEQRQAQIETLRQQPRRIDGDPLAVGAVDAPVVMIEYADYQCGYCQQFTTEIKPELQHLIDDGTLRIEWHDFPIFGEESALIAIAARAAGEQGMFWEYNTAVMAARSGSQEPVTAESLIALAGEVGVPNIEQFTTDLNGTELAALVQADYDSAIALLGQPSTPQFIINDSYIGGSGPAEAFIGVIEDELAKLG